MYQHRISQKKHLLITAEKDDEAGRSKAEDVELLRSAAEKAKKRLCPKCEMKVVFVLQQKKLVRQ